MTPTNWITLVGVISSLSAFLAGLLQYIKAQKWKRAEFVAKEIKEFESNHTIQIAMQMLDWNARKFKLFQEEESDEREVVVNDDILCSALVPHDETTKFTRVQLCIRDIFDHFLDALVRFEHFIQSDLVNHKEFRPYLIYWIEIMGNKDSKRKPSIFYERLWGYIVFYKYSHVQKLFSRYGYDIFLKTKT